jgi:3-oxoacyl-(acyl-carrier-protein) synthase
VLRDIQSGRRKLAFWGGSDAALYPWSLDAFNMMSAIARDENIPRSKQDKLRRSTASRPFAEGRSGFVPGEGAIFIGLGDPETVLRLNLPILGVLRDVGRFSDGWKGSISQSGIGDYPALQQIFKRLVRDLGIDALRRRVKGLISSHGSSTPMNELYEAFVYQKYAEAYSIPQLLIQAQKSFEGHIMGGAGGGQVISLVHALNTGEITHIRNLREFHMASQVRELLPARPNIQLIKKPLVVKTPRLEWGIALSKGFGGDNAACLVEGPEIATSRVFSGKGMATRQAYERGLGKRRERMAHMQEEYINGKPMVQYDDQRAPHGQGPLETMERMRESVELLNPDELRMRGLLPILFEPEDVW